MVILFLVFWGISMLFSIVTASTYIPTNTVRGYPFPPTLFSAFVICGFPDDSHSDQLDIVLICTFLVIRVCWASFINLLTIYLYVFFEKMSINVFSLFFDWVDCFLLLLNCMSCLYILEIQPLSKASFAKYVLPFHRLYFWCLKMVSCKKKSNR